MLNQKNKYAPDVLDCIANLSNDEVFTSPKLANQMLDMLSKMDKNELEEKLKQAQTILNSQNNK